jgi:transposase
LSGRIEVELAGGRRIRVDAAVDVGVLNQILRCSEGAMIPAPAGGRVFLAAGPTDMRKDFDGLAALVQDHLTATRSVAGLRVPRPAPQPDQDPVVGWPGPVLFAKRLEKGRFIWPIMTRTGSVVLSPAQLSMLLEGIDRRAPVRTFRPELAG